MSSSTSTTPASLNIARNIEDLLATMRLRIKNAENVVEPHLEGEVEALAGMSVTLREESTEVIDMWKSWIEGPKGKKVSEQGSENFGQG